ncbi:hypothetical protein LCGC14_2381410 [marine sediment metagenome]|uniref:Uncharacterized protein n=1 Tax=marine sediment metagenome TaxID=412755 RepID=A0A0F9EDA1_9ZZZZ
MKNWIGIPAKDIDRIIDDAIWSIGTGEDSFSCCALLEFNGENTLNWAVRKAYTHTFGPATDYLDNYGWAFSTEVNLAGRGNYESMANLRVFMLSLFRAAWRDLV